MGRKKVSHDITSSWPRLRAGLHFYLKDHHLLRIWWWNLHEIAPGVLRSNQPSAGRLARMMPMGLRSVVSFRGAQPQSFNLFEREACDRLGLAFTRITGMPARELRPAATYLDAIDRLAQVERPFVMHCKSGADRTGMMSALFLILIEGHDVADTAAAQLRSGCIHFQRSRAGVLSHVFRMYLRDAEPVGMDFRDWFVTVYDPANVTADFKDWRAGAGRWAGSRNDHRTYRGA